VKGARPRDVASSLVGALEEVSPAAMRVGPIDLSGAVEQALYAAVSRGSRTTSRFGTLRSVARLVRAAVPRSFGSAGGTAAVLVVAQQPIHLQLYALVDDELRRRGIESRSVDVNRAGPAADEALRQGVRPRLVVALARHALLVHRAERAARRTANADPRLVGTTRDAALRLAVDAARLDAIIQRARPSCVVTFNEIGTWSRLAPAVARARGIASVDLPHAEATDPDAIEGLPHDAIGVYGPRSALVMERAGVAADRIHVIGPLRYDPLADGAASAVDPVVPPRILYVSQPVRPQFGELTAEAKRAAFGAALAAASASAPSTLVVVPHPTEPADELRAMTAGVEAPPGVTVVHDAQGLHEQLRGSALVVTASSQSVFDAAIVGVPAIMVHPADGRSRVPYADEGFAVEVRAADQARAEAARLMEPDARAAAVASARRALLDRFGVVDGRAHVRAADLIEAAARGTSA
jgi:hypothetical protein